MKPTDTKSVLTIEQLKDVLRYEPETGKFFWLKSNNQFPAGREATSLAGRDGVYLGIWMNGRRYVAHRLAWFYMTGEWPKQLDHKNMNKLDNRWNNLREASNTENRANMSAYTTNRLGIKGVRLHECGKYVARIKHNKKTRYLGTFASLEEARTAYNTEAKKLFGEFARSS